MKIKDELLHIASHIPEVHTATYQADFEANLNNTIQSTDFDNTTIFPFLQIKAIEAGSLRLNETGTRYKRTWNIAVAVWVGTKADATSYENQDLIDCQVEPILYQFIHLLNKDGRFEQIGLVNLTTHHYKFNYFTTGMLAIFSLTEKVGTALC